MEIEYIPQAPKQQAPPKSEFVLVEDITGKPQPRGPQMLQAYMRDKDNKQVKVPFQVPFPPNPRCKRCYGRGYIGIIHVANKPHIDICRKCYPLMK